MNFPNGTLVEVSSVDEGFRGAWYAATILKQVGTKYLVQYQNLKTEDETGQLTETIDPFHVRPVPPETNRVKSYPFRLLEEVDACYNDGWWVGVVSKVLMKKGKRKYMVYFKAWNEETEFGEDELRPHFDWVGGTWIRSSPVRHGFGALTLQPDGTGFWVL